MFLTDQNGPNEGAPILVRWTLHRPSGRLTETVLDDRGNEFPRLNGRHGGQAYRYLYTAHWGEDVAFGPGMKHDLQRGTTEVHDDGPGRMTSELALVRKPGAAAEDVRRGADRDDSPACSRAVRLPRRLGSRRECRLDRRLISTRRRSPPEPARRVAVRLLHGRRRGGALGRPPRDGPRGAPRPRLRGAAADAADRRESRGPADRGRARPVRLDRIRRARGGHRPDCGVSAHDGRVSASAV